MNIRLATEEDLDAIMTMVAHSRGLMRADGNMTQWTGYPTREIMHDDIDRRVSFIMEDDEPSGKNDTAATRYLATFALVPGVEPTYGYIDHGRWLDPDSPYATLHRLAKSPDSHDVAEKVFAFAKQQYSYLRADTHADNRPMRHILAKEGFVESGIVYMGDGSPRVAYEWWRWDSVPADLHHFVEHEIIPQYRSFDAAHGEQHVRRVIARAMLINPLPTTYVAAAMHDLGLAAGRDVHHLESGSIIRQCHELHRWFNDQEIEEIAQAAEDHRASAAKAPRSTLGCIVAEADRDLEPETIVRRTVEYGISHYPTLSREEHWQRTLQHLHEKYSEEGYIKLWLPDSPNATPLAELRAIIADTTRLRELFDKYYDR